MLALEVILFKYTSIRRLHYNVFIICTTMQLNDQTSEFDENDPLVDKNGVDADDEEDMFEIEEEEY